MKNIKISLAAALGSFVFLIGSGPARALDTDVYLRAQTSTRNDVPNVLIILDNSGSMSQSVPSTRPAYDPTINYCSPTLDTDLGGVSGATAGEPSGICGNPGRIYFSSSGSPPSKSTSSWFAASKNNCIDSQTAFASAGRYGGKIAKWKSGSNWGTLNSQTDSSITYVDCEADGYEPSVTPPNNNKDGLAQGDGQYPLNHKNSSDPAYTTSGTPFSWVAYSTNAIWTLYSTNYMAYWYNTQLGTTRPKINIAKDAINEIINSNKNVRFGLEIFNTNSSSSNNGGRVIFKVDNMTDARRSAMTSTVNSISASTYTPLAETMWEAYRYFGGLTLKYGNAEPSATPGRDMSAEVNNGTTTPETYISPFGYSCQKSYIILVTDGDPTNDTDANPSIKTLTGNNNCDKNAANGYSCLDTLTGWMHTHDVDGLLSGPQTVTTYTVGFGTDISATGLTLLQNAATLGGGTYTPAVDADQLSSALQTYLINIQQQTTSFTAPSLSINAFNKQYANDYIYLSLFKPASSVAWEGNLKKYRLCANTDITAGRCTSLSDVLDQNSVLITDVNGNVIDTAQSYWSTTADGSTVDLGGAGANIPTPASRNMYTYYGSYSGLATPSAGVKVAVDSANPFYQAVTTDPTLLGLPNTATATDINNLINWMLGQDSYDKNGNGSTTDSRWAFADPLHSRAFALTLGNAGTTSNPNPIVKLFIGTNDGVIRMTDENTGVEEWSFVPQETYALQYRLSQNADGDHLYGLDGSPSFWIKDINKDGIIDPSAGDRVYMFIGMRRGGRNIYAFDVTPDHKLTSVGERSNTPPKLMWVIQGGTGNFTQLGQTWSQPQIARVRYNCPSPSTGTVCDDNNPNTDDSNSRVVLMFAGGYDPNQDNAIPAGTDSMGNAIYMVDPLTGSLIWWASSNSSATLVLPKMRFSIPSDLTLIDTNGDGKTDRLYVGDTGGQIWRVDFGTTLASGSNGGTAGYVFADVGCGSTTSTSSLHDNSGNCPSSTTAQDRRKFFYPPAVAPVMDATYSTNPRYDLVTIGSGDREDPLDLLTSILASPQSMEAVHNRLYAFRDYNSATGPLTSAPGPLSEADLYDATSNLLGTLTGSSLTTQLNTFKTKKGWFINLQSPTAITVPNGLTTTWIGEKVLATTEVLNGVLYATTFTPANSTNAATACQPQQGVATEYTLNALDATGAVDINGDGTMDRSGVIGGGIPSEVVVVIRPDGTTGLINTGSGKGGAPVKANMRASSSPPRTFWFEE